MKINFVVPCLLGIESLIAQELRELGADDVISENGRVRFSGDENMLARANICSRFSERIQVLIGEFDAVTFEELFQGTKALPWERWIGARDAFPVKGYSVNSTLFSVRDCQAIIKKAVVDRLKSKYGISWFDETGPVHQIQFSIMKDHVLLVIDTSGAGLHKRGYRFRANSAPIKETIAAALVKLARVRENHTLYDPLCGSGTILIEGALMACNIAPGLHRNFSAQRWDSLPDGIWKTERERAMSLEMRDNRFHAFGSDIDTDALETAKENARIAGIGEKIDFEKADVKNFSMKSECGTVICNPPYGERLLDIEKAQELYKTLGKRFAPAKGRAYYIISPDDEFEALFGRKADKRRKIYNGMIKCQFYMYYK